MAARDIPPKAFTVPAQNISITAGPAASPQACIIQGSFQQSVTFTNNCGQTIDIKFATNPVNPTQKVFNDILGLSPTAPNNSVTVAPLVANGSVNYKVYFGGTGYQPYAIQVGAGPMQIQVKYDSASGKGQCNPDPVVVPVGGTLEMKSADYAYNVNWPGMQGGPFTPHITSIGMLGSAQGTGPATAGDYTYTVTRVAAAGDIIIGGGGTVRIKGS